MKNEVLVIVVSYFLLCLGNFREVKTEFHCPAGTLFLSVLVCVLRQDVSNYLSFMNGVQRLLYVIYSDVD